MALLEIEDVSVTFGGMKALNGVSLSLQPGVVTAVIGPNGAGKTTLFNLICGVYQPSAGRIRFQGRNLVGLEPDQVARLGIVRTFQIAKPFGEMSVVENAMLGAMARTGASTEAARKTAEQWLERTGLADEMNRNANRLSVSELRRLELAKAMAANPELLMVDEVMAGLNDEECQEVLSILGDVVSQGVTVLLVEHIMKVVRAIAQTVVVLSSGEKIAEGLPDTVLSDPAVISAYLGEDYVA